MAGRLGQAAALKRIVLATRRAPAARTLEFLLYMSALAALASTLVGVVLVTAASLLHDIWLVFALLSIIVAGSLAVALLTTAAELYGQRARDIEAQTIYERAAQGGEVRPFCLYLRPFISTGAIADSGGPAMVMGAGVGGVFGERFELELQVERAARRLGRLIGLGEPLEHIGAGRVLVTENEWREAVGVLMRRAELIVMLPSSRAGTLEEINTVLSGELIRKTVFVDPPNIGRADSYDHAREWSDVQAAFQAHGFDLPAEDRRGVLLYFGAEKTPKLCERLHIDADDRVERLFRTVIRERREGIEEGAA